MHALQETLMKSGMKRKYIKCRSKTPKKSKENIESLDLILSTRFFVLLLKCVM